MEKDLSTIADAIHRLKETNMGDIGQAVAFMSETDQVLLEGSLVTLIEEIEALQQPPH